VSSDIDHLRELFGDPTQAEQAEQQEREDRKAAKRARIWTIRDLLHEETEQAEPLLGPLVRRGQTTIIGGYGGAGKSTMSMEMVRAIVTGRDFLGWEGEGSRAFVLDLEQGMSVAQRRIYEAFTGEPMGDTSLADIVGDMHFDGHWDRVRYADWQEGADLTEGSADLEVLEEEIAEHRPDVLLIDPVYKLFIGRDMNEQVEISSFIHTIQKLRTKYGFAIILPMHPRKPGQMTSPLGMHDLYGSMLWSAWAEVCVMIHREEGNHSILRWEKDRNGEAPTGDKWTLAFEAGRGFRRSIGDLPGSAGITIDERIWRYLQHPESKGSWFTRSELAVALAVDRETVAKITQRMEKRKTQDGSRYPGLRVEDTSPRRYTYLPDEEQAMIADLMEEFDATEEW
jgi:hypothetical protein